MTIPAREARLDQQTAWLQSNGFHCWRQSATITPEACREQRIRESYLRSYACNTCPGWPEVLKEKSPDSSLSGVSSSVHSSSTPAGGFPSSPSAGANNLELPPDKARALDTQPTPGSGPTKNGIRGKRQDYAGCSISDEGYLYLNKRSEIEYDISRYNQCAVHRYNRKGTAYLLQFFISNGKNEDEKTRKIHFSGASSRVSIRDLVNKENVIPGKYTLDFFNITKTTLMLKAEVIE